MEANEVKEIYNKKVAGIYGGDYERQRWFGSPLKEAAYQMTLKSIRFHLLDKPILFENYLELGPGQGTWTKFFLRQGLRASFDLVDISGRMIGLAREELKSYSNVRYFESDFLDFKSDKQYDFFFSCRAWEYLPDKNLALEKITKLLKSGGWGFIVTKTPKYLRAKIIDRKIPPLHQGQISPRVFEKMLKYYNFSQIEIYPVTMNFPLLRSAKINWWLHKIFFKQPLNFISQFFSESYLIKFKFLSKSEAIGNKKLPR